LDWRTYLWRFLVHTPNDFQGDDRRFIHQGLYLEALVGESIEVFCCIDTSGSVGDNEMAIFLSELRGIFGSYPQIKCWLWYADADCYGPYELDNLNAVPKPQGGGGTGFRPFFTAVDEKWSREKQAVICYLTDGYGSFPDQAPLLDTLWVVSPGGMNSDGFPFGEMVRLRS
jgi:predicted metal-dependent peptidase